MSGSVQSVMNLTSTGEA